MRKSIFISFLGLFCIPYSPLFAEVIIIGIEIPGLHQMDGAGAYDQIITETLIKPGLATLEVYSPVRAKKLFAKCQNCCLSPANKDPEFYEFGKDIVQTDRINTAKIYIFVNKGQQPISRLEDLQDKTVGIRRGMPYGKGFEKAKLETLIIINLEQHIRLMQIGRIDAFLAYVPDAYKMFRQLGIAPYPHDAFNPVGVVPDRLVCRGVQPEFITTFNERVKQLRISGRLKDILGDNYIAE